MTILWGDTGKVSLGTLKETTFIYPPMQETPGLNIVLPTTEPATPQISYTVQESDLVTFEGNMPLSYDIIPILYVNGKIGAATATLNYRLLLNGATIIQSTNTNQTANNFFTYTAGRYMVVKVGDVISMSLWANQPDVVVNYHSFTTIVTRLQLAPMNTILKEVKFGVGAAMPNTTQHPTPLFTASTQSYISLPSDNGISAINVIINATQSVIMYAMMQHPTYKIGRANYGDTSSSVLISIDPTNKFRPYKNWMPTTITFREISF